jgi:hypothetical protein
MSDSHRSSPGARSRAVRSCRSSDILRDCCTGGLGHASCADKGRSSGKIPEGYPRPSFRPARRENFPRDGLVRQLSIRGQAAPAIHKSDSSKHRWFQTADRHAALYARRSRLAADRPKHPGCGRGQAHGDLRFRSASGAQFRHPDGVACGADSGYGWVGTSRRGRMHIVFFASQKYIETFGAPETYYTLLRRRIVMQFADQTGAEAIFESCLAGFAGQDLVVMRTNVSNANDRAVAKGAGIWFFPAYAFALGSKLAPHGLFLRRPFDIWRTLLPGSRKIPRVRRLIDRITTALNPVKFPGFIDEMVHPNDLKLVYKELLSINTFEGFSNANL